jgi:hypothetical protein
MNWEVIKDKDGKSGTGNWGGFDLSLDEVLEAAASWKRQIGNEKKLWLCWNISHRWSLLQQRMVLDAGWTPVVGHDPNCRPESLATLPGAIFVDFGKELQLKAVWPHFPLEFSFLWAPKLAFWHADLLMPMEKMHKYAAQFDALENGQIAAVHSTGGLRHFFNRKTHRYWELLGCTTEEASRDQFEKGCGWWRHFHSHPNGPANEKAERAAYWYDSGVGISYWEQRYKKKVIRLKERDLIAGHFSEIGYKNYKKSSHKGLELDLNFNLDVAAAKMDLAQILRLTRQESEM